MELKIKKGLLGEKQIFTLPKFTLDNKFNINTIQNIIKQSSLPLFLKNNITSMSPTLLNRYKRKYFESFDKKYRLTIDSDMEYYQIKRFKNSFMNFHKDNENIVLEFKYFHYNDSEADYFSNYFPFRITKNSKYINGIELMTI